MKITIFLILVSMNVIMSSDSEKLTFTIVSGLNQDGQFVTNVTVPNLYRSMFNIKSIQKRNEYGIVYETTITESNNDIKEQQTFRKDYTFFNDIGFYKMHSPATWSEAKIICEQENAHLAIPNSQEEVNVILELYRLIDKSQPPWDKHQIFIGAQRHNSTSFKTIYDDPLLFSGYYKWSSGPSSNEKDECATINDNGFLNVYPCNRASYFVCEKEIELSQNN